MNILEQTEALKDLPDQTLVKEMQMPTGMAPPVFITAELKRRQRMRNEYKRREAQDMPTVAEEVVMAAGMPQGGIADAARAMAPKSSIAQNTGMNEMMPAAATRAPQRMAEGGIVRMAKGGKTQVVYNGVGYFVYADGDVQDAAGRPVSDEVAQAVKGSISVGPEIPEFDSNDMMPSFDVGESRTLASPRRPEGDDSPSIADVSPSLEDARGREFGPLQPEQFSSMDMVPSFDVGQLRTLADPEVIPASEQLPTRPRSIDPTYSETAYPKLSESTYDQGLESKPDTGEMQRPALPTIGSDPRISGNTEVGILPRGFQDLRLPQEVDLDLVSEASDKPSRSRDQQLLSKALEAKSLPITPTEDFRREFADYGDDISPFDPADIAGTPVAEAKTYSQLISQAQSGTPVTEAQLVAAVEAGNLNNQQASDVQSMIDNPQYTPSETEQSIAETDVFSSRAFPETPENTNLLGPQIAQSVGDYFGGVFGGRTIGEQEAIDQKRLQEQAAFKAFQERGGFSEAVDQSPDPSGYSETTQEGASTAGFTPDLAKDLPADPTLSQGIASIPDGFTLGNAGDAASNALSFGNVNKLISDDAGGDKKPTTPTTPSVTGTGSSPLRDRISRMLDEREANKESDKWMALAQTGLALMASKNPTIGGALGEAGLVGVGALQKAKSSYDKDILSLLGMQEDMRTADLNYAAKVAKANKPTTAKVGDYSTGAIRFLEAANEVRGTEKVTDDMGQTSEVPKPLSKLTEDERREYDKLMSDYYSFLNSIKTKLPTTVDVTT
tara:strand:+ start:1495 stop:3843 length:2349 start_codon:yes stop_codon:yes gene_type:complete